MKILTHATVFTGEALHENCSVVIADGRIRALALDDNPAFDHAEEVDLKGAVSPRDLSISRSTAAAARCSTSRPP